MIHRNYLTNGIYFKSGGGAGGGGGGGGGGTSAKQMKINNGAIPVGTILEASDGKVFRVDRSNGFVISGRDVQNKHVVIDLRRADAKVQGKATSSDWFYKGQLSI